VKSIVIRDSQGQLWRFSPDKKTVRCENDHSIDGGYPASTYQEARNLLADLGYLDEDEI
jgi:hypothetical protein